MRCPKCDFEVKRKDKFCPYCGHQLSEEVKEEIIPSFIEEEKKEENTNNNMLAIFAYLGFLFFIPLIFMKDSKLLKYHVNQGIILCIANAIVSVVVDLLIFTGPIYLAIETFVGVIGIIYTVYGIYNVVKGKMKPLPIIGKYVIIK